VLLALGMECVSCHYPCHSAEGASRASDRLTPHNKTIHTQHTTNHNT
jgi:hypothetical protein